MDCGIDDRFLYNGFGVCLFRGPQYDLTSFQVQHLCSQSGYVAYAGVTFDMSDAGLCACHGPSGVRTFISEPGATQILHCGDFAVLG